MIWPFSTLVEHLDVPVGGPVSPIAADWLVGQNLHGLPRQRPPPLPW